MSKTKECPSRQAKAIRNMNQRHTEKGLWRNNAMKSLNLRVIPIANMMKPSEKRYEVGPAFTNHAKAEGFRQATTPPTLT